MHSILKKTVFFVYCLIQEGDYVMGAFLFQSTRSSLYFVSDKEFGEWGSFLLKAVDHNLTKLNLALTNEKLSALKT